MNTEDHLCASPGCIRMIPWNIWTCQEHAEQLRKRGPEYFKQLPDGTVVPATEAEVLHGIPHKPQHSPQLKC